jgi:hypothetical protein
MRVAIGLIGLSVISAVVPTGFAGIAYAAQVLAGTAGALVSLLVCCLAGAFAVRRTAPTVVRIAPRRSHASIASSRSIAGSI